MSPREKIDRSFDGQLDEAEWAALQRELLENPDLLEQYVSERWLHADLQSAGEELVTILDPAPNQTAGRGFLWLAAAAALVFFCSTIFLLTTQSEEPGIATLLRADNCKWSGSELPTAEGSELTKGLLALEEGMATIQFHSGATVTLEAPTTLELESPMRARLLEGSVVADVPDEAHGFTIDTRDTEVIDLGTKFGVTTTNLGSAHVFVFEGEVKVKDESMTEAKHILAGKHLHLGDKTANPPQPLVEEIARNVSVDDHKAGWIPVSTGRKNGKDAYFRRGHRATFHRDPLLMVKHTNLAPGNERKFALTFDLSGLERTHFSAAKLALKLESSGLGFSSLVPDSRFAVVGIRDQALAKWDETKLNWETNEPFLKENHGDSYETLAEFTISKGSPNEIVEIESPTLTSFLKTSPGDTVTVIIERLTGEFDKQGLVHAFASKEHPTSPAPTLWIKSSKP